MTPADSYAPAMRKLTLVFAVVFIFLGVGLYLGTGRESVTALIPAFIGLGMAVCAALARTERSTMHAMHVSVLLAILGFGGSVPGVIGTLKALGGAELERPAATYGRAAMAVLCLVYVALAVRSFIQARRARKTA